MHQLFLQTTLNIMDIAKQGPVFMLLLAAIGYFYKRQQASDAALKDQAEKHELAMQEHNRKLEQYLNDDRQKMLIVIENNSKIMQDCMAVTQLLKDHISSLKVTP